jgi:CheY-like chemotaxis protein
MILLPPKDDAVSWTRDALEGLYDLSFLKQHAQLQPLAGRLSEPLALQQTLQEITKQLKPPVDVPRHSPAWRIYNVLNLRYLQALTQAEAAGELNLSVRQFKREQERAVRAVASVLFTQEATTLAPPHTTPVSPEATAVIRIEELLQAAVRVLTPVMEQHDLHIVVEVLTPQLPAVRANRIAARQLFISALGWQMAALDRTKLTIAVSVADDEIRIVMTKPYLTDSQMLGVPQAGQGDLDAVRDLAEQAGAWVGISDPQQGIAQLMIHMRANPTAGVLVVDDNADMVALIQRYLEQSSEFHPIAVMQPADTFKAIEQARPDCILLDVMMPQHDGWEVLEALKADAQTARIPVIISSVIKVHDLARVLGAADVLLKPFSAEQLIALLRTVVADSRR